MIAWVPTVRKTWWWLSEPLEVPMTCVRCSSSNRASRGSSTTNMENKNGRLEHWLPELLLLLLMYCNFETLRPWWCLSRLLLRARLSPIEENATPCENLSTIWPSTRSRRIFSVVYGHKTEYNSTVSPFSLTLSWSLSLSLSPIIVLFLVICGIPFTCHNATTRSRHQENNIPSSADRD